MTMTGIHRLQTRFTECGRIRIMRVPFSQLQQPRDLSGRVLGRAAALEARRTTPSLCRKWCTVFPSSWRPQRLLSTARGSHSILSCSQWPAYFLTFLERAVATAKPSSSATFFTIDNCIALTTVISTAVSLPHSGKTWGGLVIFLTV